MQPTEQAERQIPLEIGNNTGDPRVARELPTDLRVQRRAAVAVDGLPLEDLPLT